MWKNSALRELQNMAAFNERLRQFREAAELTQEGLARRADLSLSFITKLERGGMDPSWSTVQRLAKALGVSTDAFVEDDESAPKKSNRPRKK
jgi:transcriptional regulator with XRE-family HTH domain